MAMAFGVPDFGGKWGFLRPFKGNLLRYTWGYFMGYNHQMILDEFDDLT